MTNSFLTALRSALGRLCLHRNRFSVVATILLALQAGPARADVWGYVDAKGVAHFSVERLDERYELFSRGNESFSVG